MPDDLKPKPISIHIREVLDLANDMLAKPSLAIMGSQMWIIRARAVFERIYGVDSPAIDFWCPRQNTDAPTLSPHQKILTRLPRFKHFASLLDTNSAAPKIFIGHGGSSDWLRLRTFLSDTMRLQVDEFNIEPNAGTTTTVRIENMLSAARLAFLVMTAEDQHQDGTFHARENVIHEIGLFQARLGPTRAIVLLEDGCARFSNLDGLTTINFPRGDILARKPSTFN